MTDLLSKEVQETAQRMADEVHAEMRKHELSPKRQRAAFEAWVVWHLAVLSVTLNRLCENVEILETRGQTGEVGLASPGQETVPQ